MDDSADSLIHAGRVTTQNTLDLRCGQGKAKQPPHLLSDLIHTADHAQLQAAAGGGVGDSSVQAHQIHCPAPDIRHDDRGFVQQFRLGQNSRIALGEQRHIRNGDGITFALIPKGHRPTSPEQIVTECFLIPPKTGQGQACCQMDICHTVCSPKAHLHGDGRKGQKVIVLCLGFVFLERLAAAAHNIKLSAVLQHTFSGVGFVLIFHQSSGKRTVCSFHGRIAMVHADHNGFAHLVLPRFFLTFSFLGRRAGRSDLYAIGVPCAFVDLCYRASPPLLIFFPSSFLSVGFSKPIRSSALA